MIVTERFGEWYRKKVSELKQLRLGNIRDQQEWYDIRCSGFMLHRDMERVVLIPVMVTFKLGGIICRRLVQKVLH